MCTNSIRRGVAWQDLISCHGGSVAIPSVTHCSEGLQHQLHTPERETAGAAAARSAAWRPRSSPGSAPVAGGHCSPAWPTRVKRILRGPPTQQWWTGGLGVLLCHAHMHCWQIKNCLQLSSLIPVKSAYSAMQPAHKYQLPDAVQNTGETLQASMLQPSPDKPQLHCSILVTAFWPVHCNSP